MKRIVAVLAGVVLAGCAPAPPAPRPGNDPPVVRPAGVEDPAHPTVASAADACGDPKASLRPDDRPGTAVAAIRARGFLIAGVNQNAYQVGYRDPKSGELVGFEIDIVRAIAQALFGDPTRVRFAAVNASASEGAVERGDVDLVVRTKTMTCAARRRVAFSTEYYTAYQRVLVPKNSTVREIEQLAKRRICAAAGSTSLTNLRTLIPTAVPVSTVDVVDCLVLLQQHQVDAVSTSDILLAALADQDPHTKVVGRKLATQPYGVAIAKSAPDLVRFVNGVLERIRADGTWTSSYNRWLSHTLGAAPPPPAPIYQ